MNTLNGNLILRATVLLPAWGIWWADVQIAADVEIDGAVQLDLAGLRLSGTVIDGDTYRARGWWRIVGGAGKWRTRIPARPYDWDESGVKLGQILGDAARDAGEPIGTLPTGRTNAPAFLRLEGVASRVLELFVSENWYVDESGVTQIGQRAASPYLDPYVLIDAAPSRRLLTVAAEDISALLPGAQLEDMEATTVRHELTSDGLRSHIWTAGEEARGGLADAMRKVHNALSAPTLYHRSFEYSVTRTGEGYCDIVPVRTTLGLPNLANIIMRAGSPGSGGDPALGSTVLCGFVDGDPCRPYLHSYEGEAGAGWIPTVARLSASLEAAIEAAIVRLAGGGDLDFIIRNGDKVAITGVQPGPGVTLATLTLDATMLVAPGAPGTGHSKAVA